MPTGLGPTDYAAIWGAVFSEIATVRAARSLPAATLHLGQEWLQATESPPRIVVVPTTFRYGPSRQLGGAAGPNAYFTQASSNPKAVWRRIVGFDAYCWGDESPSMSSPPVENPDAWYGFSSATELERELLIALRNNLGGAAAISEMSARWEQSTDMLKLGRLLIVSFAFDTPVTQEPYVILPFASETASGVQVSATMEEVWPDGTSTIAGVIVTPP
jgi:hypothetical protein